MISAPATKLVVLTYNAPPIPTPPATTRAPLLDDVEVAVLDITNVPVTVLTPTNTALVIVLDQTLIPSTYPTSN